MTNYRSPIPDGVRKIVLRRCGGFCEMCVQRKRITLHHRKQRSVGGRHLVSNLLGLCRSCHDQVHREIEQSHEKGRLVHSWEAPLDVQVLLGRGWVYLDELGTWRTASPRSGYDGRATEAKP